MLSIQKSASDWTGLGYGISSSNIASTSATIFVPPARNTEIENIDVKISLASENLDKGKSILGAPLELDKKDFACILIFYLAFSLPNKAIEQIKLS